MPGIADPGRLVAIHRTMRSVCCGENSFPLYRDISESSEVFSGIEAHFPLLSMTLGGQGEPETVWGQLVTSNYFSVLGVRPAPGSFFDERLGGIAGGYPFAIISHSLWQRRFGSDPSIAGRQIVLNKGAFTVWEWRPRLPRSGPRRGVGCLGAGVDGFPGHAPASLSRRPLRSMAHDLRAAEIRSRRAAGTDFARGACTTDGSGESGTNHDRGLLAEPARSFHPGYRGAVIDVVALTMGAVALLLLVACANVANLLLARATSQRRETAIRSALGASRGRLLRESEPLPRACGRDARTLLSILLTRLAGAFRLPISVPLSLDVALDVRVLLFSMGLSVLTGLAFGATPALGSARQGLVAGLRDATATGRDRPFGVRNLLVLGQVAASVLLLIVTGLFLRSLLRASAVDPGFRIDRLVLLEIDPRLAGDPERLMDRLRERIRACPA